MPAEPCGAPPSSSVVVLDMPSAFGLKMCEPLLETLLDTLLPHCCTIAIEAVFTGVWELAPPHFKSSQRGAGAGTSPVPKEQEVRELAPPHFVSSRNAESLEFAASSVLEVMELTPPHFRALRRAGVKASPFQACPMCGSWHLPTPEHWESWELMSPHSRAQHEVRELRPPHFSVRLMCRSSSLYITEGS